MPPKAAAEGVEDSRDVMLLINFIRTAKDFKPDLAEMAQLYGIADKKNVPRKINRVLTPHGFKWNAGKIEVDDEPEDEGEDGEDVVPMTPAKATRKATRTPKSKEPKTPTSNKKRKIEEEEPKEEDADIAKSIEDEAVERVSKDDDDGEA